MKYKGYWAKVNYSDEDKCFWGKVEELENDLILFEGNTVEELRKDFENAIDTHIEFCEKNNKEPKKQYKGSFNVRLGADLHRKISENAKSLGMSLNQFVKDTMEQRVLTKKK